DGLAGVRDHAPEDGHHGAEDHAVAVVDRLAGADAGEQLVVLLLVHVAGLAGGLRRQLPGALAGDLVAHDVGGALRAQDVVADVGLRVVLLAEVVEALDAVGPLVDDGVVVEDVAVLRLGAHLAAAGAAGPQRRHVLHGPGHLVDAVHRLLDDVVAGQPGEVQPVAHLPLPGAPVRLARLVPQAVGVLGPLS